MIVETHKVEPGDLGETRAGLDVRRLSDAGGLTQFGAHRCVLAPGAQASEPHWHECEDEFVHVLEGTLTLVEDGRESQLRAGDSAVWPAGEPLAHTLRNDSDEEGVYLVVGTRVENDVVHYPGLGRTLFIEGARWRLVSDRDGSVIKSGVEKG